MVCNRPTYRHTTLCKLTLKLPREKVFAYHSGTVLGSAELAKTLRNKSCSCAGSVLNHGIYCFFFVFYLTKFKFTVNAVKVICIGYNSSTVDRLLA